LEHNGHLIEEKIAEICVKIDEIKSYFYETQLSQSLIVNLVEERPASNMATKTSDCID
jgi:hypothetical protein